MNRIEKALGGIAIAIGLGTGGMEAKDLHGNERLTAHEENVQKDAARCASKFSKKGDVYFFPCSNFKTEDGKPDPFEVIFYFADHHRGLNVLFDTMKIERDGGVSVRAVPRR